MEAEAGAKRLGEERDRREQNLAIQRQKPADAVEEQLRRQKEMGEAAAGALRDLFNESVNDARPPCQA